MAYKRQQLKYMGDLCRRCGKTVEDVLARHGTMKRVFQFHHSNPDTKHPKYENVIRRNLSTEQLDELDKCVLLCSFCHDLVEAQDIKATVRLKVEYDGRTGEQTFKGHMVWDRVENRLQFITNEQFRLNPYSVTVGEEPPRMEFENELMETTLVAHLRGLPTQRTVVIRRWPNGPEVFRAELLQAGNMRIAFDVRCPFLTCELRGETNVWTRNGCALTESGEVHRQGYEVTIEAPVPT